jgi:putative aldouronate transport system permease protein
MTNFSQDNVHARQIAFFSAFLLPVFKLLETPSLLAKHAGGDLLLPALLHCVLQAGLLFLLLFSLSRTDKTMAELLKERLGKWRVAVYIAYAMALTSLGAYAFTKKDVPGLKIIFMLILFTMFFGGGLVPFYLVVSDTVGTENLASIIIPFGINTFNMIILRNFFSQVPDSIIESCRLDGASEFRILFTFVIPLSKAGMATIILYYLVGKWDDWYWPAILLANTPRLAPLALKIRQGLNNERTEIGGGWDPSKTCPEATNAAMMIIGLIPIMAVYPFLQRYFTKGVMLGGVKG